MLENDYLVKPSLGMAPWEKKQKSLTQGQTSFHM